MWMSAKLVLQMSLNEGIGNKVGSVLYKVMILKILESVAVDYTEMENAAWDITAQILVKLARRVKKLSGMGKCENVETELLRNDTVKQVLLTIDRIHKKTSQQWQETVELEKLKVSKITRSRTNWINDCIHKIDLRRYKNGAVDFPNSNSVDNLKRIDPVVQTTTTNLNFLLTRHNNLSSDTQDIHMNNKTVWIYHVEWFVRNRLKSTDDCSEIFNLLLAYTKIVFPLYGEAYSDPIYFSRMAITVLKVIAVLDEIAVAKHPVLKAYATGILTEMFECFLTPDYCEMVLVENLQNYFRTRNANAEHPDWLATSDVSRASFPVTYAKGNWEMSKLKAAILRHSEAKIEQKKAEIKIVREQCKKLQARINSLQCEYTWSSYWEKKVHDSGCVRCKLTNQLQEKRNSVSMYQHPLPSEEYLRDAVVFELLIPLEIAHLRDATCVFSELFGNDLLSPPIEVKNIDKKWMEFGGLSGYSHSGHQELVHVGSEYKDVLSTHYNSNPDISSDESSFIVENGMNCKMYKVICLTDKPRENAFTFQISKTCEPVNSTYNSLQFSLKVNRPTENEVIANQYSCHQNITVKEFITFGTMRCGHNIQLRNLYAAIANQELPLHHEPVLALVMQTVWELGPGKREIYVDFERGDMELFCEEFLDLLRKRCGEKSTNWSNPVGLLLLVIVTVKILEMTEVERVKESAAKLLQAYRVVAEDWCDKLEDLITNSSEEEETVLMELLVKCAICSAFTFNVSRESLTYAYHGATDITFWMNTLTRLHHSVVRQNVLRNSNLSSFMKNLLRHARVTIPLNIQEYLHELLAKHSWNKALHTFVASKCKWVVALNISESNIPTFKHSADQQSEKKHAYQANYDVKGEISSVCVDILRGTFLVDGYPPSLLPESITRNPLFGTFFRNSKFHVQRNNQTFNTENKYRGHDFEFTEIGDRLFIRQISSADGSYLELIPRELFKKRVPRDLINEYTHWLDSKDKVVYFRRVSCDDDPLEIENDTDYVLKPCSDSLEEWHLVNYKQNDLYLLSIKSPGFEMVTSNLQKFESHKFIHVIFEDKHETRITAKLLRMNMVFSLNQQDGLLYCDKYPGFYVPALEGQNLGTLVGLESGVVLEKNTAAEASGKTRLFLIQHGTVEIMQEESAKHQKRSVAGYLRNPPYFAFTIDQVLKRLHGGNTKSAWLYLALLHASTSSPFPDPFTQLTGTEMASWILQSGFVWSCSPYDNECVKTLEQVTLLSPKYSYYPSHLTNMIKTTWPPGLEMNSYAAYDGYAIIYDRLLKDCSRFEGLFRKKFELPEMETNLSVCRRSYFRNINMYNGVAHLKPDYIEDEPVNTTVSQLECYGKSQEVYEQLMTLAEMRQKRKISCYTESFGSLVMTSKPLPHNLEDNLSRKFLNKWFSTCVRKNWLQLYSLSRDSNLEHELTMLFGAMVYSGKGKLNQVLNLHNLTLVYKSDEFPEPVMSLTNESFQPLSHKFICSTISNILKEAADSPPSEYSFSTHKEYVKAEDEYRSLLDRQTNRVVECIRSFWPGEILSSTKLESEISGEHLLNATTECLESIEGLLVEWKNNLNLKEFVDKVDVLLKQELKKVNVGKLGFKTRDWDMKYVTVADGKDKWVKGQWSFEDIDSTNLNGIANDDAKRIFSSGKLTNSQSILPGAEAFLEYLQAQRAQCIQLVHKIVGQINDRVIDNCAIKTGLRSAGIHLALPPVVLLRDYLVKWEELKDHPLACMIGCLAVLWANIKRFNRLIKFKQCSKYAFELEREVKTNECENWKPLEYPEWLALELELDLTIRPIQVQVAMHMMNNMSGNGVMQLNMGEGKTSVIVPMVVSTLSKGGNMLCRVTVLNSIFATNEKLLAFAIGGFVDKRVYTVPCGRDLKMYKYLKAMKSAYKECLTRGVVITLPEYRLSFRLQMYNSFIDKKYDDGYKMYEIENWLRSHARDIVDESDEVFSVKYQLIYTTGKQVQVDGGSLRWRVCQKIFELLPNVALGLVEKFGKDAVEFLLDGGRRSPEGFRQFRILTDECKEYFNGLVAEAILNGKVDLLGQILSVSQREIVKEFLVNEHISEEDHEKFEDVDLPVVKKEILLLISGYLRRGILFTALRKRWRVEYGVKEPKPGGVAKYTAVPFRAKDVASERTEFGHPDMAIVLTQLSYYNSGLTDEQLLQCFDLLDTTVTGPEGVYNAWIMKIPGEVHQTISTYGGVNLQDYDQRKNHLFPVLRYHKDVIDFWLSSVGFPHECKQFPGKLVTNAWDLCYERSGYLTSGFSGTNDTSLLLPAQINQDDLKVLMDTNARMEKILMGEENGFVRSLGMGVTCREVISYMKLDELRVLIDAGALMLELGNEEIAELWLELDENLNGVVYFNKWGEMVVKVRGQGYKNRKRDQLLALSCESLDQFAVYLDDQHTRGTDIKLPSDFKACVTVGSGMRRDKLIQACWRMRKLGKGQSVHFYLSHEVRYKVSRGEGQITTREIVEWVKGNSLQFEIEGLVYWATNALTYGKNLAADDLFELSDKSEGDALLLGTRCQDMDAQSLLVMYGAYCYRMMLVDLIPEWFSNVEKRLADGMFRLPTIVVNTLDKIKTGVLAKIKKHIPKREHLYVLEEEQEKELEPEQQEERRPYRPSKEDPVEPFLHDNVRRIVMESGVPCLIDGVSRLNCMFKDTSVWGDMCEDGWEGEWYVTDEFINVIKSKREHKLDCFLRRPRYLMSFQVIGGSAVLVLSQFEINSMITRLRDRNCARNATLHMFTGRWVDGQCSFVNRPRLQLPLDMTGRGVTLDEHVVTPLLIAAGNLYFESLEEQKAFARFLGLALREWTREQVDAHERGFISATGFVSTSCPGLRVGCNFERDPTHVVRQILRVRNDVARDSDHVVVILERCAFLKQEGNGPI